MAANREQRSIVAAGEDFNVVILAGQRAGIVNPIAERAGVSHKCLAPICGKPLILHVFEMLAKVPGVARVRISQERDGWDGVRDLTGVLDEAGIPVDFVPSHRTLTDSVNGALADIDGPTLITTADNVLTTREAVLETMRPIFAGADASVGLTRREAVIAARGESREEGERNVGAYRFRDGHWCNCNLYAVAGRHVTQATEAFREGGQFAKNRGRLIRAVGLANTLLLASGLVSLDGGMRRLSKRFGIRIAAARLDDGSQAVDVDSFRTYDFAEKILTQRQAAVG